MENISEKETSLPFFFLVLPAFSLLLIVITGFSLSLSLVFLARKHHTSKTLEKCNCTDRQMP